MAKTRAEANKTISKNRPEAWVKKMIEGKYSYASNPTRIRQARLTKQISQDAMSTPLDLSQTTYGDIERGKRKVKKYIADEIAKKLGKKVSDLFEPIGKKFLARK